MSVEIKDSGYLAFYKSIAEYKKPKLITGVFGDKAAQAHQGTETSVGEVAAYNEFGTSTVPERSFVRSFWDESEEYVRDKLYEQLKNEPIAYIDWKNVLRGVGTWAVAEMKKRMRDLEPVLAPSTVARKGHDETLIDSGQLRDAIDFEIR